MTITQTPLHLASLSGTADVVKILLEAGASTMEKDNDGRNALTVAIINRERHVKSFHLEFNAH